MELWDMVKSYDICVIRVSEEEKKNETEANVNN